MPGYFRPTIEPVWVIECAAIDPVYCRKPFQVEKQFGAAGGAEIDGDAFPAALGSLREGGGFASRHFKGCFLENRLYQVSRSGCSLTKFAMTIGDPYRLGADGIPDIAAKAATLKNRHFDPRQERNYDVTSIAPCKQSDGFSRLSVADRCHACTTKIGGAYDRLGSD
jgi:hypothetical protein